MSISITEKTMLHTQYKTYSVEFFGDEYIYTTVTHNPKVVTDWINQIKDLDPKIVGLHYTETRGCNLATLQLCVGDRCLIYQICHSNNDIPESLALFFSRDHTTFVGVGVKYPLNKLKYDYGIGDGGNGVLCVDALDLAAKKHEAETRGSGDYKMIFRRPDELSHPVLGRYFMKPWEVAKSNWSEKQLTADQVMYACLDAYVCFRVGHF